MYQARLQKDDTESQSSLMAIAVDQGLSFCAQSQSPFGTNLPRVGERTNLMTANVSVFEGVCFEPALENPTDLDLCLVFILVIVADRLLLDLLTGLKSSQLIIKSVKAKSWRIICSCVSLTVTLHSST